MEFNLTRRNSRQIALVCMAMLMNWAAISAASDSGRVPPSPDKPWFPAPLSDYESELAHDHFRSNRNPTAVEIDANKVYDLPELIDIGERSNPQTRIAWEHARQAAAAVGLSQSAYFPFLAASAGAGYERAFIPFPTLQVGPGTTDVSITGGGNLTTEAVGERAALGVKWLVCDFGERKAELAMAKEGLMAANVGFNAVHQQIVFAVTQHFYDFNTARQKVAVAESAVKAADTVARSARARFDHGLAIKPEVLQAEQQSAQAVFDLVAARGTLSDAGVALVDSLGILPTTPLHVAEVPDKAFSESVGDAEELIDRALSQRPDLVAKLANVRAKRALVSKARAAYYPKIAVDAHVGDLQLDVSVKGSPYFGGNDIVYGAGVLVDLPVFDGYARRNKLRAAESELQEAEDELSHSRDSVIREVWKARTDFETALQMRDSAAKLAAAAESAFSAALDAYRQGLGTYVDVANAQHSVTAARSVVVDTRSAIYTSASALALSVGDLARPARPGQRRN